MFASVNTILYTMYSPIILLSVMPRTHKVYIDILKLYRNALGNRLKMLTSGRGLHGQGIRLFVGKWEGLMNI